MGFKTQGIKYVGNFALKSDDNLNKNLWLTCEQISVLLRVDGREIFAPLAPSRQGEMLTGSLGNAGSHSFQTLH